MAQPVLWTDDTPIRTLAPGTGRTRLARFWCYAVDPRPYAGQGPPAVLYRYSPDRKGERPRSHLAGFRGYLHADAYAGYDALYRPNGGSEPSVIQVACMAHARRKFFEVFEARHSPIAEEALLHSPVRPILWRPKFDKEARLLAQAPKFEAGQVLLPREAPWLADYISELLAFPNGAHDDQVDSTSQALHWLSGKIARGNPPRRPDPKRPQGGARRTLNVATTL
jgi:hypothetical protein